MVSQGGTSGATLSRVVRVATNHTGVSWTAIATADCGVTSPQTPRSMTRPQTCVRHLRYVVRYLYQHERERRRSL